MKLVTIRPMLWTWAFADTIEFYTKVLGFTCAEINQDWGWAALRKDDIELMVTKPNPHIAFEKPTFTGSFYIQTEHVAEYWEKLKDVTRIVYPMEDFDYGMREFAVYDNNGYILQFGEEIS